MAKLLIAAGALVCLIAFFFFPWVVFSTLTTLGNLPPLVTTAVQQVFGSDAKAATDWLRNNSMLSGRTVAFGQPFAGGWLTILVILPSLVSAIALVLLVLRARGVDLLAPGGGVALAIGSLLSIILLLSSQSMIVHLSIPNQLLGAAMDLLGPQVGIGFWLTIAGLAVLGVGSVLDMQSSRLSAPEPDAL